MQVVNSTANEAAVFRSDGVRLYGLDAEVELKLQAKRDPQYEKDIAIWIQQVSGQTLDYPDDIAKSLKSGIVLCRLINAIQPNAIRKINTRPIALMEVENIQMYLKACWKFGVPASDLFVASDLFNQKDIPQVLQNIVSLARVVQAQPRSEIGCKIVGSCSTSKKMGAVLYLEKKQQKSPSNDIDVAKMALELKECNLLITQLREKYSKSQQECLRLEQENKAFAEQGEVEARNQSLTDTVTTLQQTITQLESTKPGVSKSTIDMKLGETVKALAEKQKEFLKMQESNRMLQKQVKDLQQSRTTLEKDLQRAIAAGKLSLDGKETEISKLHEDNTKLATTVSELQQRVSELERQAFRPHTRQNRSYSVHKQDKNTGEIKVRSLDKRESPEKLLEQPIHVKEIEKPAERPTLGTVANHSRKLSRTVHTIRKNRVLSTELQKRLSTKNSAVFPQSGDIELDSELLTYTKDCMADILFSKPIEFADVYALNELFRNEAGRRQFTQIMHQTMKEIPSLTLSDNSFELLLYLINTVLQQMDLSDSKDLITAKILMNVSCSLTRRVGKGQEFIQDFINNFEIWKNIQLWEHLFWDELATKHRKRYGDNIGHLDKHITLSLLSSFGYNMIAWGVEVAGVKRFIEDMASKNSLQEEDYSSVMHYHSLVSTERSGEPDKEIVLVDSKHSFREKQISSPVFCLNCNQFIWGQGLQCIACKQKCHKKCMEECLSQTSCSSAIKKPVIAS